MGGKIKQRTKGNTKPSSSGRAAELLSREGSTGFIGFGNVDGASLSANSGSQFMPAHAATHHDTAAIHADFQVVMKKCTKRDAVTRLKAVQEFGELCKTCDMDAVLGTLPYWPSLYNRLAMDIDYRVREAAQQAMNQMALRVGRNLAPHLKNIMGVWLCAQCDTYSPVASAAQKAFCVAFAENKQAEVLGFCKKEVIEYLIDNLMNQTLETMSDPELVSEKDCLTKYIRVISSSLLALGKFMMTVGEEVNTEYTAKYSQQLLSEKKFWKLGRHKAPQIRSAFFFLVAIYCEKLPCVATAFASSLCPIVLSSIDEVDATVSSNLWESVLQVVTTIQDCWQHVNMEKAVLPKLWNFLSNAGHGSAATVMVTLLPFLSKLPDQAVSPESGFSQKMFSKLIEGLNQTKVQQSPSECKAVVSAFMDCVSYVVLPRTWNIAINDEEMHKLRTDTIDQLITVLDSFFSPKCLVSSSLLYERLSDFLRVTANLEDVTSYFWRKFDGLIIEKLSKEADHKIFSVIVTCLHSLKYPGILAGKCQASMKVRFKEDNEDKPEELEQYEPDLSTKEAPSVDVNTLYGGHLLKTVNNVLRVCVELVVREKSESHLMVVTQLLKQFCCVAVLKELINEASSDDGEISDDVENICELSKRCINVLVLPLLIGDHHNPSKDDGLLKHLVGMIVLLINQIEEDDKVAVVGRILEFNSSSKFLFLIVNEFLKTGLSGHVPSKHGLEIGERVVSLLKTCLSGSGQTSDQSFILWKLIDLCFVHEKLLGFLLTEDKLKEIFETFYNILIDSCDESRLRPILKTIENFIQNTRIDRKGFGHKKDLLRDVVVDILKLKLFKFTEQGTLSVQCCQSMIQAAASDDDWLLELTNHIVDITREYLYSDKPTTMEKFNSFVEASVEMMRSVARGNSAQLLGNLQRIIPVDAEWDNLRLQSSEQSLWFMLPFLDGELVFIELPQSAADLPCKGDELTAHEKIVLYLTHMTKNLFVASPNEDESLLSQEWRVNLAVEFLWMREYLQRCRCLQNNSKTQSSLLTKYNADLEQFLDLFSVPNHQLLLLSLFNKSHSSGGLWSLALKSFILEIQQQNEIIHFDDVITTCRHTIEHQWDGYSQAVLQTLQCLVCQDTSIYRLKVLVEVYGRKWRETTDDDIIGHVFCVSLIVSALERWVVLSRDSEIAALECRLTMLEILEDMKTRKHSVENTLFLFSTCLDKTDLSVVSLNLAIMRLFRQCVVNYPLEMSGTQWDMVECSMLDWLESCKSSDLTLGHVVAFTNHVCQLVEAVSAVLCDPTIISTISTEPNASEDQPTDQSASDITGKMLVQQLSREWLELFGTCACNGLLLLITRMAVPSVPTNLALSISHHHLGQSLASACAYLTVNQLKYFTNTSPHSDKPDQAMADDDDPKWHETFFHLFSPYLESPFSTIQVASCRLLNKIVPVLAGNKKTKEQSDQDNDDPSSSPPDEIISIITEGQTKLHELLLEAEVPFGESLIMSDDHEALHIARSFLLAWKLLLEYFVDSTEESRVEYANFLRRGEYLTDLLEILFRILPHKPPAELGVLERSKPLKEEWLLSEQFVHCLAFEVYYDLLRTLPALVRQWWNNLDKMRAAVVERYTTAQVSPLLCTKELQNVQRKSTSYENMEIVTRSSTREVIAYYKIEDISIELIVSLSASHPLGLITVNCGKRVGVKINQWRLWMMQLTTFLMHQNGSIIEGLMLWKRNVDKKFEGVDECMICFSVIHGSNYSLPKLSCRTCKKKFHSACLYKWFSTSNNSTCPVCRNLF